MNNIKQAYLAGFMKAAMAAGMMPPIGAPNQPPAQQAPGMQNSQPPAQQAPSVGQPQAPGGLNQFMQLVQQFKQRNGQNLQQPMLGAQSVKPVRVPQLAPPGQPQPGQPQMTPPMPHKV